jgi:class 3 adenylate cyclase/tetratricopeptide (TPR) repeat protein
MRQCASCGTRNRESARFCDQCGTGFELPPAAGPVPAAGAGHGYTPRHLADKVLNTRAAMVGERKPVTVLFADIKGSTRLAEQVGAEAWHGILNQFFAILSGAVHRLEGTVNQYTGDGIMALFGAPIAHEDHAARACFAALEMQRELKRFGDSLRASRAVELQTRIGLNTGEVVVGSIGDDLRMDYTAKGLTVNLAARMEQICRPGAINISRYTAALVGGDFRLRDLGDQNVEGASHPVRVYELEGEHLTQARQHRPTGRNLGPIIGRRPELDQLQDALTAAQAGRGQIVTVSGEAGIGKSRLCREFAQHCWSQGVAVHHAVCVPYSASQPLVPVRALLRSRLQLDDRAGADDVERVVRFTFASPNAQRSAVIPLIAEFLGAGVAAAAANLRSLMLQRIARYLPQSPRAQVLIVEDLQNGDAGSIEFMLRLAEQISSSSTVLLINHRSDWSAPALSPFVDVRIELQPLTPAEVERQAVGLLGGADGLAEVASGIADRAQGNPFFVEEAVKALAETGHLAGEPGRYVLARPILQWPVPQSVQALIGGRIDRLPEEQKNLLQAASIIGRRFDMQLLDAYAGAGYFNANLAALVAAGFMHALEDGRHFEFTHPLTQEVAYQSQLESARARLHAALAEVLEERTPLGGEPDENAVSISHHWIQAGNWERAGAWSMQAARWFAQRDVEAALAHYRLAISHLDRADHTFDVLRGRIAARAGVIGLAQLGSVSRDEVDLLYDQAWRMAEEFQDVESGAALLFAYCNEKLHRGEADAAVQLAADAVGHAQSAGARTLIGRYRHTVLATHNAAGRFAPGLLLATIDGEDWLHGDIDEQNFLARGFYGAQCTWRGRLQEARAHLEASLNWAEAHQRECIWQCADLVDWAGFAGDPELAVVQGERALRLARSFGSPYFKALALRALGLALCHQRQPMEALKVLEEARPLAAEGSGAYPLQASLLAVTAAAHLALRRWDAARRMADEALSAARRSSMRMGELQAWMVRLRVPDTPLGFAFEGLQRMQQLIEQTGAEVFRPWWLRAHARYSEGEQREEMRLEAMRLLAAMGARGVERES